MTEEQIKRWREEELMPLEKLANELRELSVKMPREVDLEEIEKYYKEVNDKYREFERLAQRISLEAIAYEFETNWNNIVSSAISQFMFISLEVLNKRQLDSKKKSDEKIKELEEEQIKMKEIKDNLFNFFGLIVGLLAFIFVNYQFISSAKDLGIGKMLMFMGIANVGLILGIFLILGILGDLLGQPEKLKNSLKIMKSGWLFLGIIAIIVIGFSIDLFDRRENYDNIDEKINKVQERVEMHDADLYNELGKRDLEIERLKLEIENLKNKK